jgi:hypothetical protein
MCVSLHLLLCAWLNNTNVDKHSPLIALWHPAASNAGYVLDVLALHAGTWASTRALSGHWQRRLRRGPPASWISKSPPACPAQRWASCHCHVDVAAMHRSSGCWRQMPRLLNVSQCHAHHWAMLTASTTVPAHTWSIHGGTSWLHVVRNQHTRSVACSNCVSKLSWLPHAPGQWLDVLHGQCCSVSNIESYASTVPTTNLQMRAQLFLVPCAVEGTGDVPLQSMMRKEVEIRCACGVTGLQSEDCHGMQRPASMYGQQTRPHCGMPCHLQAALHAPCHRVPCQRVATMEHLHQLPVRVTNAKVC